MDKIEKLLARLTSVERKRIKDVIERLMRDDKSRLDIKKLKGYSDIFRVRSGDIRIIYTCSEHRVMIIKIQRRNEGTYQM